MLNFSVSDTYLIRSLTHDLLVILIHFWKECGIVIKPKFEWDVSHSVPSSHMHRTMVHSLFELAVHLSSSFNEPKPPNEMSINHSPLPIKTKNKNLSFPVEEILMTIYLHAFPFGESEEFSERESTSETNNDEPDFEAEV